MPAAWVRIAWTSPSCSRLAGPQLEDERPHLGQRLALQLPQLAQHLARGGRVALHQQLDAAGGQGHAEQRLGHRVVELLGQPCPLLCRAQVGRLSPQVVLQPDLVAQVAHDAVRAAKRAVAHIRDGAQLDRHRQPVATRAGRSGCVCGGNGSMRRDGDRPRGAPSPESGWTRLAKGAPRKSRRRDADGALEDIAQEGEPAVPIGLPHDVRGVGEQVVVAPLRVVELLVQPGVGDRDGGHVGERLEQLLVMDRDVARLAIGDGERADDVPVAPQRGRGHAAETHPDGGVAVLGVLRDPGVVEVVGRPDDASLRRREPVDAAAERELHGREPRGRGGIGGVREDGRHQEVTLVGHQGEMGAIRAQQAARLVHDPLEHLGRLLEHRDAGGDGAQDRLPARPAGPAPAGNLPAGR